MLLVLNNTTPARFARHGQITLVWLPRLGQHFTIPSKSTFEEVQSYLKLFASISLEEYNSLVKEGLISE